MFNLYDVKGTCVASYSNFNEAKVKMLYLYCGSELPRLAKTLEVNDYLAMVSTDKKTAFNDGYIEDFMTIKEED